MLSGEVGEEEPPAPAQTISISEFVREDGTPDLEGIAAAAEGGWHPEPETEFAVLDSYAKTLVRFLHRVMEEASIWEATGCLPDNVAYNRQAWWRLDLWLTWIHVRDKAASKRDGGS